MEFLEGSVLEMSYLITFIMSSLILGPLEFKRGSRERFKTVPDLRPE
jgi:hypothetical protein